MSPRAACRLDEMGFEEVYDYVAGKLDWLARGRPTEGARPQARLVGRIRDDVVTCLPDDRADAVRHRIEASPYGFGLVVSPHGVLLGRVRRSALDGAAGRRVEDMMEPGPSTVRASEDPAALARRLAERSLRTAVVTTPDGELLGIVQRDDLERAPDSVGG
jgi:CBS domain-containing protein